MRLPAAQPQGRCQKCSPELHTWKTPTSSETVGAHGWAHATSITPLILVKACCSGSARPGRRLRRGLRLGRALRRPHHNLAVGRARVQLLAARTVVRHLIRPHGPLGGPAPAAPGPCTAHGRKHREAHRGAEQRQAAFSGRTSARVRPAGTSPCLTLAEDCACRSSGGAGLRAAAVRQARTRLQAGVVAEAADGVQVAPQQTPQLARCQVQHLRRAPPPSRAPRDRCMPGPGTARRRARARGPGTPGAPGTRGL